jgi:hypothetical protein
MLIKRSVKSLESNNLLLKYNFSKLDKEELNIIIYKSLIDIYF